MELEYEKQRQNHSLSGITGENVSTPDSIFLFCFEFIKD